MVDPDYPEVPTEPIDCLNLRGDLDHFSVTLTLSHESIAGALYDQSRTGLEAFLPCPASIDNLYPVKPFILLIYRNAPFDTRLSQPSHKKRSVRSTW